MANEHIHEDQPCFRNHEQATERFPVRDVRETRGARRLRGQGTARETRTKRSVPVVQDTGFKNCCMRSGRFDGSERKHYSRN